MMKCPQDQLSRGALRGDAAHMDPLLNVQLLLPQNDDSLSIILPDLQPPEFRPVGRPYDRQ